MHVVTQAKRRIQKGLPISSNLPQCVSDLEKAGSGSGTGIRTLGEAPKGLQENKGAAMFILADTLPVIPAKLVKKIQKGKFVDMAELLKTISRRKQKAGNGRE